MSISSLSPASLSIPERATRYLDTLPAAVSGSGGHDDAARAAGALLHGFCLPEPDALALLLTHYNPRCLPPWNERELAHKVRSLAGCPPNRGRGYLLREADAPPSATGAPLPPTAPAWPTPDARRVATIIAGGPTAAELSRRSPAHLDETDSGANAAAIIAALFVDAENPDPLLCVGRSAREFATLPLSRWTAEAALADHALIVPARMTARTGRTRDSRESEHTLENTGPRRFVVVEFDAGTADEHAAILWHLSGFAPLALVVHSGRRGLHGWFPIGGAPVDEVRLFMRYAASLGADPALFRNRSQFVRLPGGTREGDCRQSVFYWNPAALAPVPAVNGEGAR